MRSEVPSDKFVCCVAVNFRWNFYLHWFGQFVSDLLTITGEMFPDVKQMKKNCYSTVSIYDKFSVALR